MEVDKHTASGHLIRDYWPRYRKKALLQTVLIQVAATVAVGSSLVFTGTVAPNLAFWTTISAVFVSTITLNILLLNLLLSPLRDLASALTRVAGEPSILTPPNPNAKHFERDGFKPLLDTIYSLAATEKPAEAKDTGTVNLAEAFNSTTVGVILLDHDRRIIYANKAAPVELDSNENMTLPFLFENDDTLMRWLDDCNENAVHAEKTWRRVPNKIVGEENRRIFDVIASYQKGSKAETILTVIDRTNEYAPEDESLDFIAFAAHELRGPITVIRGYLDVLQDELGPQLSSEQVKLFKRAVVSANQLSSYVNNILNTSRYDRRHLRVHLSEENLADIYAGISDDMRLRAAVQNRLLSVDIPRDLPTVAADKASISEVISNLIDNALKYSHEGGSVEVTATQVGNFVRVSVTDHGIGMPANVIANLFNKFYRSHRSRESVAGTGIGLYICKAIVESHGGIISVRSREGQGSTFEFTLPIYATVAEKLAKEHNNNEVLIKNGSGWIKNHAMFRG